MDVRWHDYRFHTVWRLPAAPAAVYAVLADAGRYPSWWPQVREVRPHGTDVGEVRFRSFLPYELRITARAVRQDESTGTLEIAMTGDLVGGARWTVSPDGAESPLTRVDYEQWVEVQKALLRRFAVPGRPVFLANHALMMWSGQRGLRRRLALGLDEA